ncbi:TRAP transporter small permease [Suttonella sp. R2A3]|uniref:TRAP transporter small permease n=1 Tax=Suttonella sp. R2A3 TaxID=2908648 RepID=UPI001F2DCBF0|nr:TRAP transporter small permease [Suttonella sp. R2A3]UJF24973.1 TRAP transporter small permease [Suttonella sp. R2A3]
MFNRLNRLLNGLYRLAGLCAALSIIIVFVLIIAQIIARQLDTHIPSSGDLIGFAVVWATFLGLPYTMQARGHIRVELFITRMRREHRRWLLLLVAAFACTMLSIFSYFIIQLVYESWHYGDVTDGEIAMPLWLMQLPMAVGAVLFTLSMLSAMFEDFFAKPAATEIT